MSGACCWLGRTYNFSRVFQDFTNPLKLGKQGIVEQPLAQKDKLTIINLLIFGSNVARNVNLSS